MRVTTPTCIWCDYYSELGLSDADMEAYLRWQRREVPIQEALPHWSPAKREQLMTGTHPECFDTIFGSEEN